MQSGFGFGDALGIVVGALGATSQNDEAVVVTCCTNNGDNTGLCDGKEVVRVLDSAHGIDGDAKRAIGSILEADGETQTTCQFTVQLALRCARTNGTNAEQISKELRRDGIQHLACNRHALACQIDKELARQSQSLVDLEAAVNIWVVDETLPTDRGARLLEVRAHHDEQLVFMLLFGLEEQIAVGESSFRVMDRTRAHDNEQSVLGVLAIDDGYSLIAAVNDCLLGLGCLWDLML